MSAKHDHVTPGKSSGEPTIAESGFYVPYIDGLRGLAILGVLLVHISQYAGNDGIGAFRSHTFGTFVNAGGRGVQLFFILSAFTLYAASRSHFDGTGSAVAAFYIKRSFRILPLWWLAAIAYMFAQDMNFAQVIPTLFMYFGFIRHEASNEVIQFGWSIFVEESFYLFLPLLFMHVSSLRRAVYFLIALLAVQFVWVQYAGRLGVPTSNNFIMLFPLANWYCFGLGLVIFFLMGDGQVRSTLGARANGRILDFVAVFLVLSWLPGDSVYPALALAAVFMAAASEHSMIGRLCRLKYLKRLGAYCYSIYLFHGLVLSQVDKVRPDYFAMLGIAEKPLEVKFLALSVIVIPICYGVGHFSFRYLEKPCVLLGRQIIGSLASRKAARQS